MTPSVVGLIVAGGRGQRLGGVRKADLRLGNKRLLEWAMSSLMAQCGAIVVSVGSQDIALPPQAQAVRDDPEAVKGPAAGLWAGALWCAQNAPGATMVSVAVDTPFFPRDFAARAGRLLSEGIGCVVASHGGRDYPINALWKPAALLDHLGTLPVSPRGPRVRDVEAAIGMARLVCAGPSGEDPFVGINILSDLLALSQRAGLNGRHNAK